MKFTEFLINNLLTETINMTQYRNIINQSVIESIDQLIDVIPSYKRKIDVDVRNDATQGEYHELLYAIRPLIIHGITTILRLNLTKIINSQIQDVNKKVSVLFKDITANGIASNSVITLSNKFPIALADMIVKTLGNWLLQYNKKTVNKFKLIFEISSDELKKYYDFSNIPVVYQMVNVILHELTHVVQDARQEHRGGDIEYRSYLTKNPIFNNILDKMHNGDELSDEEFRAYLSSPQEIAAHAHNIAADVIKSIGNNKPTASDIQKAVTDLVGKFFSDKTDPRISKIYNRYLKLVYQQVMNHLA